MLATAAAAIVGIVAWRRGRRPSDEFFASDAGVVRAGPPLEGPDQIAPPAA